MSRYYDRKEDEVKAGNIILDTIFGGIFLTTAIMWGCPQYNVWEQGLVGQAELRRAEQNRQIAIQEARARLDSSRLLAEAEIERAKGVAASNNIIGDSLDDKEEYLRYLWIMTLERANNENNSTIVYIPTEANIPVLEAQRLAR